MDEDREMVRRLLASARPVHPASVEDLRRLAAKRRAGGTWMRLLPEAGLVTLTVLAVAIAAFLLAGPGSQQPKGIIRSRGPTVEARAGVRSSATTPGATTSSAAATGMLEPTPKVTPTDSSRDAYPSPVSVSKGVVVDFPACPNSAGLEQGSLTERTALAVLNRLLTGSKEEQHLASDPAYWPLLTSSRGGKPLSAERVQALRPASESPYGELLTNACGRRTVARSWWVEICPGQCGSPHESSSLMGHYYLLKRDGRWLVWASK